MIPLAVLRDEIVVPACGILSVAYRRPMCTRDAVRMMLAVTQQEDFKQKRRQQNGNGQPLRGYLGAAGLWQFERDTIGRAQRHAAVTPIPVFGALLASADPGAIFQRLTVPSGDMLAAVLARLLLWCDPQPLPTDEQTGWACYAYRVWKPGRPNPEAWARNWQRATEVTEGMA